MSTPEITPPVLVSKDPLARVIERQDWLSPEVDRVQVSVRSALNRLGPTVRSVVHGDWLHEPLHAVMTDVPVGSWTAAVVFDAIGAIGRSNGMDQAADAAVILGLLGAMGAAATGMNDWAEIKEEAPRRIGAVHAVLNITGTLLFGASCFERRKRGSRANARALAILGYLVTSVSAHLGGNLTYEHGIGVTRGKAWPD